MTFVCYINEQVSMGYGTITAYALIGLEARGILFVSPGVEVVSHINSSTYLNLSLPLFLSFFFLFFIFIASPSY